MTVKLLLSWLIVIGLLLPVYSQAATPDKKNTKVDYGNFEVIDKLPGIDTTSINDFITINKDASLIKVVNVIWLAGLGFLVGVGLISIVVGGYMYMTAGGDSNRISLAKTWIVSALAGIIVGLFGWLILNTISDQFAGDVKEPKLLIPCKETIPQCQDGYECKGKYCEPKSPPGSGNPH